MSEVVFRANALYGKRDPNRDFEWLRGRSTIPEAIFATCEYLARTANEVGVALSSVAALPDGIYLARSFNQGIDTAFRPSFALEVGTLDSSQALAPEHMLGLAWLAIRDSWPKQGPEGDVLLEVPPSQDQPVELEEELVLRARLGLPVSAANTLQGLALLRRFPHRYRGVAIAPKLRGNIVPWSRELAPLLAVHFGEVELDEEESALLAHAARRPPEKAEWEALDLLEGSQVRKALLWAANGGGPLPGSAQEGVRDWLVAFRRRDLHGAALIAALRSDLALRVLPENLLGRAFPDLSRRALDALSAHEQGSGGPIEAEVLAELAAAGLLGEGSPIPPKVWLPAAPAVEAVERAGVQLLQGLGVPEAAARWLLARSPSAPLPVLSEAARAAAVARSLELEMPPEALRGLVERVRSQEDLAALGPLAEAFGPPGLALCAVVRSGTLPPPGELAAEDLLAALAARHRLAGPLDAGAVLRDLLEQGRTEEARAVLAATVRGGDVLPSLPPAVSGILEARLSGAPPVRLTTHDGLLPFAQSGLLRPGDVIPCGTLGPFLEVAAIWPETAPLAAVLRGELRVPAPGVCPPGWRAPLRQVLLEGDFIGRWLARWQERDLTAPRLWLCEVLDVPAPVRRLAGEPAEDGPAEAGEVRASLPWIRLLWRAEPLPGKLRLIADLAAEGWFERQDRPAAVFVRELFAGAGPELRELCVHLLSRVGPMPPPARIAPDLLALLVPVADPVPLVNALFAGAGSFLAESSRLLDAVAARVEQSGLPCPDHRYTAEQLERHAPLACRLSRLSGWEHLSPDPEDRQRIGRRLLAELDLPSGEAAVEEPSSGRSPGIEIPGGEAR